jgi:hypothetical protein
LIEKELGGRGHHGLAVGGGGSKSGDDFPMAVLEEINVGEKN